MIELSNSRVHAPAILRNTRTIHGNNDRLGQNYAIRMWLSIAGNVSTFATNSVCATGRDDDRAGLPLAHTTIVRWAKRFTPGCGERWNPFAIPTGRSSRVDETPEDSWKMVYLH